MPFTLAHPAAVLCLPEKPFLHRGALVLGAMSPDFIYFLQGRAANGFGHTLLGALCLNLPLVCLFYALYRWRLRAVAMAYLLQTWAFDVPDTSAKTRGQRVLVFLSSALLGMATHVFWDAFTHQGAWFVEHISFLNSKLIGLPVYKWLQYSGGIFGLAYVAWVWRKTVQRYPAPRLRARAQKRCFWAILGIFTLIVMGIWQFCFPVSALATQIIRLIDCVVVLWLAVACLNRQIPDSR
ncbi:DUF4184 family protein [Conchiformibius steedae DSM 2580]|uniref:DUF4184 family protein n=1 Tax=Conchiformibius steedae DSM 2580 TaxID=1121352 RepID=A0AAE9KZ43_9NEIS|nr:DUF4184 family protein [Conchiformibius steedae]QMT33746.1 DUF4184 family protein [Conchiformibius steedae]URD68407.1 DUF4184 family protein [Conchiformibius steedae DSM 2580]